MALKVIITVVRSETPWGDREISRLVELISNSVSYVSHHPKVLLLPGRYPENTIRNAFPSRQITFEYVEGLDNPKLPFMPSFLI
jgi:hypothetical protein